ncbi:hypothetical protein PS903_02430 [Pseudomonas fluorescens]|nr:hypothetical protein PS903_02430 [Pseudomonas fluorescens]
MINPSTWAPGVMTAIRGTMYSRRMINYLFYNSY